MTPAAAFVLLTLAGAPDLPPLNTGLFYKYAAIDYYATANRYNPFVARRQIEWESGMGAALEAWRYVKITRHKWAWRLISRGAAMLNVRYEREHFANAGVRWTPTAWRDFRTSIQVGMSLMGRLLRHYRGDVRLALAAYNAGAPAIDSGRRWTAETKRYVREVFR